MEEFNYFDFEPLCGRIELANFKLSIIDQGRFIFTIDPCDCDCEFCSACSYEVPCEHAVFQFVDMANHCILTEMPITEAVYGLSVSDLIRIASEHIL